MVPAKSGKVFIDNEPGKIKNTKLKMLTKKLKKWNFTICETVPCPASGTWTQTMA